MCTVAWNFYKDTKLKKLFFEIKSYKGKKMQSSRVIFPFTMSHVIIKIPKEEHKKNFCAKINNIFLSKKLFPRIKREKKLFEATEWLKKLCVGLPKWEPLPGRKIIVHP